MNRRTLLTSALTMAAVLSAPVSVHAQAADYPAKPITIIVPFAAGGNTDVKTRLVALQLSKLLGQPVIIDNKPGASGNIGMELLSKAAPDGYTIGMGSFGPLAVNPSIYPKINFDPRGMLPIYLLEKSPLVLVTPADRSFRSVKDVVTAAKQKPGQLSIANAGPGGAHHLSAELFEQSAAIDMLGVPYKGGGPASTALLAGQVDLMFEQTGAALPSIQAGKVRALAVTSPKRLSALPEVPTFAELGYAQVLVSNWMGYVAPKGTPKPIIEKLSAAFVQAAAHAEVRERILSQSNELGGGSPGDFAAFIDAESQKWSRLVKERNIRIE